MKLFKNLLGKVSVQGIKDLLWDLGGVFLGTLIAALGFNLFLVPNQIAAGGISGLGVILWHVFGIPVGLTILVFNLPLFLAGVKILGARFGVRTLAGTLLLSVLIEATVWVPNLTQDSLLAAIYGGIIVGVGIGIVFRFRGTTGGTALSAQLLNHYTGLTVGQGIVIFDVVIIALAGYFFSAELALYAIISLVVSSKVIDMVQQGIRRAKAAMIISDKSQEISREILEQLGRGVTTLDAKGQYTGESREMVLVVINRLELSRLKHIVRVIDPRAFVVVSDAAEVLGEGFRKMENAN